MSDRPDHIVITGTGLITPLGLTAEQTWRAILDGRCGMGPLTAIEQPLPPGADGGQAPELPGDFAPELPRETRYLRRAVLDAIESAGLADGGPYAAERRGILLGTTLHGMRAAGRFFRTGDHGTLSGFLAGSVIQRATAHLDWSGCSLTTCSACSSSLGSIALAVTMLRTGRLDVAIAGGYDTISEYVYGGFNSLRLVAAGPLRPFARGRAGMKLAEGYGIVVLERAQAAHRRGAVPLARVLGFGESADAHHLTQPHPAGEGAARAMAAALRDAGVAAAEIDLVAAHATGTPDNDAGEHAALARTFGDRLPRVPVIGFKSHLGHTLGGAGAVELICSAMAIRDQVLPACANVDAADVEFPDLRLLTGKPIAAPVRATLNTSLGFGGANTCVVLGDVDRSRSERGPVPEPAGTRAREVFITGIGVVFPGVVGNEAMRARLRQREHVTRDTGAVADAALAGLLNARRVRRMSDYVKLSLAATVLCLRDAGIEDGPNPFFESCAAVLGTCHGSSNYSEAYYGQIVREGIAAANPMLFAEGVPNAAAAHLSLMLSLKGPCQTVIGSRTAGLDAIRLAAARVAAGEWDRAIVGAAEEYSTAVNATYAHRGLYDAPRGFVAGAGAVTLLIESRPSLEARRGRPVGRVLAAAGAAVPHVQMPQLARRLLNELGNPSSMVTSANGTWIDEVEAGAVGVRAATGSRPYDIVAECYSVLPLAGLAAALLAPASPNGPVGVLATDYAGGVSGVSIQPILA